MFFSIFFLAVSFTKTRALYRKESELAHWKDFMKNFGAENLKIYSTAAQPIPVFETVALNNEQPQPHSGCT
jgi:hypothetical protein